MDEAGPAVVHLAGHLQGVQAGEYRHTVGNESRAIFPSHRELDSVEIDAEDMRGTSTAQFEDIVSPEKLPSIMERVVVRVRSRHGTSLQSVELPKDASTDLEDSGSISLFPSEKSNDNILFNASFEEYSEGLVPVPWSFDVTEADGPLIAARVEDPQDGRFVMELLPRSDGEPSRISQRVPVVPDVDSGVKAFCSAWAWADTPGALHLDLMAEQADGSIERVGHTEHPGDGAWHKLSFDARIEDPVELRALHVTLRREQVAGAGKTVLDKTVLRTDGFTALGATVDALAIGPSEYESKPVTVPRNGRLELALSGYAPFPYQGAQNLACEITLVHEGGEDSLAQGEVRVPAGDTSYGDWNPISIDLGKWVGQRVRFRFSSKNGEGGARTMVAIWGGVVVTGAVATRDEAAPPNVILVSLDTLRADHLGCYGYQRETSPNLDAFAESAHLFEHCLAPSSWTTPSHASVFTGDFPAVHGAGVPRGSMQRRSELPGRFETLAEFARDQHYRTVAFTEGYFVGSRWGLAQGFERYSDGPGKGVPTEKVVKDTFTNAQNWVEKNKDTPFFLFVHTYGPHWPYTPPSRYLERFVGDPSPEFPEGEAILAGDIEDDDYDLLRMAYDASIAYTDEVFGEFIAYLERERVLDNTIVIVFSDHGEEFGEHGGAMHGLTLYNEVLEVPLLIRTPGQEQAARHSGLVCITDIYGTVRDALGHPDASRPPLLSEGGAASREYVLGQLVHPQSQTLHFTTQSADEKLYVVTPYGDEDGVFGQNQRDFEINYGVESLVTLTDWVEAHEPIPTDSGPRVEYFRLGDDPQEQRNVIQEQTPAAKAVAAEAHRRLEQAATDAAADAEAEIAEPLSPEEAERFEAIGYIQD